MPSDRKPNVRATAVKRKRRFGTGTILSLVVAVVVTALLVTEQVALLYVLATLSVSALLLIVAFSSFGEARAATEAAPLDDAALIADRAASAAPQAPSRTPVASSSPRG